MGHRKPALQYPNHLVQNQNNTLLQERRLSYFTHPHNPSCQSLTTTYDDIIMKISRYIYDYDYLSSALQVRSEKENVTKPIITW